MLKNAEKVSEADAMLKAAEITELNQGQPKL